MRQGCALTHQFVAEGPKLSVRWVAVHRCGHNRAHNRSLSLSGAMPGRSSAWRPRPFGASGAREGLPHEGTGTAARCGLRVVSSRGRCLGMNFETQIVLPLDFRSARDGAHASITRVAARTLQRIGSREADARHRSHSPVVGIRGEPRATTGHATGLDRDLCGPGHKDIGAAESRLDLLRRFNSRSNRQSARAAQRIFSGTKDNLVPGDRPGSPLRPCRAASGPGGACRRDLLERRRSVRPVVS